MIQLNKEKDKIVLSLVTQLDKEDVADLILDLQAWLMNDELPKFKGIDEKAVREAKQQNDSKNRLSDEMRRCFVDVLDSEYVQKELITYQLDPISKEVITKTKKLSEKKSK